MGDEGSVRRSPGAARPARSGAGSSRERGGRAGRRWGTQWRGERAAGRAGPGRPGTERGRRRGCGRRDGSRGWLVTQGLEKETRNTQTSPAHPHAHTLAHSHAVIAFISFKIMGSNCGNLGKKNLTLDLEERTEGRGSVWGREKKNHAIPTFPGGSPSPSRRREWVSQELPVGHL